MEKELRETVVLVTGASSGIGEATALRLAEAGMHVAVAARRKDRLDTLAPRITAHGVEALVMEVDITVPEQADAAVNQTVERFGRLDALINNAGVMLLGPISTADYGDWERMIDLNLKALMRCTLTALPHLTRAAQTSARRVADVVNISSTAGRVARPGAAVYNATKFGVGAFSEAIRQEVTKSHVRVALVEPGAVATELAGHNRPDVQERMNKVFAEMERLESVDIADAVHYVVSRPRRVAVNEMLVRPTEQEY